MNILEQIIENFYDEEFLKADGFDDAVIGLEENEMRLIYSVSKCIKILNIGIGINIVSNPDNTLYHATNLRDVGIQTNADEMIRIFFKNLKIIEKLYIREGIKQIYKMWGVLGHKIGDPISVKIGDNKIFGIFNGLNDEGGLLILNEAGCEQVIMAGDVFLL